MQTDEQLIAKAGGMLKQLEGFLDVNGDCTNFKSRIKALEDIIQGESSGPDWLKRLKSFDPTKIEESYEKLHEGQRLLQRSVRNSKNGLYVPGVESHAKDFSLLRTMIAVRTNDWANAGLEKEILGEVKSKYAETIRAVKGSQIAGDDELGGNFIPDQVIPDVIQAIYTKSAFLDLNGDGETRLTILDGLTGGTAKIPKFLGGLIAYWMGEEDTFAESMIGTGDVTMSPKKLGILVRITDTMKRLQSYGFETLLRKDMVRAAAKKIDWTCIWGTGGDNMPLGMAYNNDIRHMVAANKTGYENRAAAEAAAVSDGGDLDFDLLDEMDLYLEEDDIDLDSPSRVSSPRAWRHLRKQKVSHFSTQTTEKSYLIGAPMIPDNRLKELIGDFGKTTQITASGNAGAGILTAQSGDNNGKCTAIVSGELSEVVFGRWAGIEIEDDGGRGIGFTSDHTYMKLKMYGDIGYRQPRAQIICLDAVVRA